MKVVVELGTADARAMLAAQGAEAATYSDEFNGGGHTILFHDETPSASAVLEEYAHVLQAEQRRFSEEKDALLTRSYRELEAHLCLDRLGDRLGLPLEEQEQNRMQIEADRRNLEERLERWQ